MLDLPYILAQDDGLIQLVLVIVFLIIGLIAQVVKKFNERRQQEQQQRRPVRRRSTSPAQARPPVQPARPPAQPRPQQTAPQPPRPPRPAKPPGPPRAEIIERIKKVQDAMDQQQSALAKLASHRQQLLQHLKSQGEIGLEEESRRLLSDATRPAVFAAAFAKLAGQVAGPTELQIMLASREHLRQAMLYHEIFSPPLAVRPRQGGMWDQA